MERRELLKAAALAGAPAMTAGAARPGGAAVTALVGRSPADVLRKAPPVNLDRAYEIMERRGLDGMVVSNPVSVYHLTGFWPATSRMGYGPGAYALLSRDPQQRIGVVAADFTYYYLLSDNQYEYPYQVFLFTAPTDREQLAAAKAGRFETAPAAAAPRMFPDRRREPQTATERSRGGAVRATLGKQPASPDAEFALVKAIRAMGLARGTIAVDSPQLERLFTAAALPARTVAADEPLQLIRVIKSPREVELMRLAATANREAALAAAGAARAGATYRELRSTFYAEAARRGNRGVFMVIGGVSAEGVDRTLRDGDAFLFDAVSEGAGYHGDFARTVFVGEPSATMKRVTAGIELGWAAVRDALRPGLKLSQITAIGHDTLKKAGYDFFVAFGPHSVGLYHTDAVGLGDFALQAGMILSVDCPVMQSGIGGTAHLEDLTLITANGSQPIHPTGAPTIQV